MGSWRSVKFDWTIPKTASQILEEITAVSQDIVDTKEWKIFERIHLNKAQAAYPKLDLSLEAKCNYILAKHKDYVKSKRQKLVITAKEFFKTAYNWEPFSPTKGDALAYLLTCGHYEDLPLGIYNGHKFYLMPGFGALPITGVPVNVTDFDFAHAGGAAIAYPDGHPSEANQNIIFRSKEDDKLRHIMPLGWLVRIVDEEKQLWERTGHALVMDMDEGRQRHPWIVLANSWPDDRENYEDDLVYADQEDEASNSNVHGILPGTNQRTPVGRLTYGQQDKGNKTPLLLSFRTGFEFGCIRFGGRKAGTSSIKDEGKKPPLATIMNWHDDAAKCQLVCYDSDGKEYMRYHKGKKEYKYLKGYGSTSTGPATPASRFIPLDERLGDISISGPSRPREKAGTSTEL